jgi:PelA/Pel-15E family pectate lyase
LNRTALILCLASLAVTPAAAGVVGQTIPAPPLTAERVDSLGGAQKAAWLAYLERSRAAIAAERAGGPAPARPEGGAGARTMPLKKDAAWYASAEARHIADVIVSFQTPAGGWGKNQPRNGAVRARGQDFTTSDSFVGTLDNDATITEMRFLARVIAKAPKDAGEAWRGSFERGLSYLLVAQYPNGGWPQVYPLQGGYHDAITLNDDAMISAVALLDEIAAGRGDFAFVAADRRAAAKAAWARGLACLLTMQVVIDGRPTGWSQQHDPLTLAPVGARNYEPGSLASAETAGVLLYLMRLQAPPPAVRAAVDGGAKWLASAALRDKAWTTLDAAAGRQLVHKPGAQPLWSRYYDLKTLKPIFGDRDLTLHDDVNELSLERRNGYSWFNTAGANVAEAYAAWGRK